MQVSERVEQEITQLTESVRYETATFFVLLILLNLSCAIWAYRDAVNRKCSRLFAFLLVLLIPFPVGILLWTFIRPRGNLDSVVVEPQVYSDN